MTRGSLAARACSSSSSSERASTAQSAVRGAARRSAGVRSGSTATWTVHAGDDLWSISAETLTRAWKRIPTEQELAPYWWRVVQVNRPFLPNPNDPNLLLPGDRVVIPAPPMPPAGR